MTKTTTRGAEFTKLLTDLRCSAEILLPGGDRIGTVTGGNQTPEYLGGKPIMDCSIQAAEGKSYLVKSLTLDGEVLMGLFNWE